MSRWFASLGRRVLFSLALLAALPALAEAQTIFVDPPVATPDANGLVRFSVNVNNVPEPSARQAEFSAGDL